MNDASDASDRRVAEHVAELFPAMQRRGPKSSEVAFQRAHLTAQVIEWFLRDECRYVRDLAREAEAIGSRDDPTRPARLAVLRVLSPVGWAAGPETEIRTRLLEAALWLVDWESVRLALAKAPTGPAGSTPSPSGP